MAIVQGVIALAHTFNREIVAEGIETREHHRAPDACGSTADVEVLSMTFP